MADNQPETNDLITIVSNDFEKHIFFHGLVNSGSAFAFCTNITALDLDIREERMKSSCGFSDPEGAKDNFNMRIVLHLNCAGGSLSSAFVIADTIERLETPVDCIVEGNLASAGIIVMLACENRTMSRHGQIYFQETIHAIDGVSFDDLKSFRDDAIKTNKMLKDYYIERTGLSTKVLNKLLKTEKNIDGQEALKLGFINVL